MILALLCLCCPMTAQEAPAQNVFTLRSYGLDALLPDAKDAGLKRTLRMADERLMELVEIGMLPAPPTAIPLLSGMLSSPMRLAIALPADGSERALLDLSVDPGSDEDAQDLADEFAEFLGQMGLPTEPYGDGGVWSSEAPGGMWAQRNGARFGVRVGAEGGLQHEDLEGLLPDGTQPALTVGMDLGVLFDTMKAQNPYVEEEFEVFDAMGFGAFFKSRVEYALGYSADRSVVSGRMLGAGEAMKSVYGEAPSALHKDLLGLVPADATFCTLSAMDMPGVFNMYNGAFQTSGLDLAQELKDFLGMDVEQDLLAHLGNWICVYTAESGGGGGLMSMVAVAPLKDSANFQAGLDQLSANLDGVPFPVAVEQAQHAGVPYRRIAFPGFPVPIELCVITTTTHMIAGFIPQTALAALRQLETPAASLLQDPDFLNQWVGLPESFTSVQWMATPRLMRDGYGATALLTTALRQSVRSQVDGSGDQGLVLPLYADLLRGAKGSLTVTWMEGDDVYTLGYMDRSTLVNGTGLAGVILRVYPLPLIFLGAVGAAAPMAMARGGGFGAQATPLEFAPAEDVDWELEMQSIADDDMAVIRSTLTLYAVNNGGKYPSSLEELVLKDENGESYLEDEWAIIDPWGRQYTYSTIVDGQTPVVGMEPR